jgi:polyisoprenoid-binding protein YceI
MRFDPNNPTGASLAVTVRADSLTLVDQVRPADRQEIETRMRSEVLEISGYPEIRLDADDLPATRIADNRYRLGINGVFSLHGVTQRQRLEAELLVYSDGVRATGELGLRLSDYRIRPVTALGGTIKLKDELRLKFDIAAWKSAEEQEQP